MYHINYDVLKIFSIDHKIEKKPRKHARVMIAAIFGLP